MDYFQIHVVYVSEPTEDSRVLNELDFVIPAFYPDEEILDIAHRYVTCVSIFPFTILTIHNYFTDMTWNCEQSHSWFENREYTKTMKNSILLTIRNSRIENTPITRTQLLQLYPRTLVNETLWELIELHIIKIDTQDWDTIIFLV